MPLSWSLSFRVLTNASLHRLQEVSDHTLYRFLFSVLTSPSLYHPQRVSAPRSSLSFLVLTNPLIFHLQRVSAPRSVAFFLCLTSPGPSICRPQNVSAPLPVARFRYPDKSFPFPSPGRECFSPDFFISVSRPLPPSVASRK